MRRKVFITGEDASQEAVWMTSADGTRFQVENIPMTSYNISLGDLVELEAEDGRLYVRKLVGKSGHRTIRVILRGEGGIRGTEGQALMALLREKGCDYEGLPPLLLAIDIPPAVSLEAIVTLLQRLGVEWEYGDPQPEVKNYYL